MGQERRRERLWGLELHEACTLGDLDAVKDLLRSGKLDVNSKDPDWQDRTPLHWACAKGYVEIVRLLLKEGGDPGARMSMGWTPVHCAAEAGRLIVLKTLQLEGADLWLKDDYGDTPYDVACTYGQVDCATFMKQSTTLAPAIADKLTIPSHT